MTAPPLPGVDRYSQKTRAWYAAWVRSPQARKLTAKDWRRLHMAAPLVEVLWDSDAREDIARRAEAIAGPARPEAVPEAQTRPLPYIDAMSRRLPTNGFETSRRRH